MIDFDPGDELGLLVETARRFAEEELAPRRREAEAARGIERGVREAFDRIGLGGLELPERLGGGGLGPLARVLVNEELAAGDVGAAVALDALGPAVHPLVELFDDVARERLVAPLSTRPGARAVLVEGSEAALDVAAERISGRVPWVPADRVDLLIVCRGEEAFAVREGIRTERLPGAGLRAAGASALVLDGAPIAARARDAAAAARARGRARLHVASLLVGVLRHAEAFARGYAQQRVAFGRPIAHHQGLAFLLTDLHMAVEGARWLVLEAAWRAEEGLPFAAEAAAAFVETVEVQRQVGPGAVQVLGGHGFMQDHPVEKAMREARVLALWLGGVDAAREEAGRALCAGAPPLALSPGGVL